MPLRVILFLRRCRGYVLSIIDAPDDRSRERLRKSGLRETHSILKGIFYCVLLCNVRDHAFARVPRVSSRVSSVIKYRYNSLPRRRIAFTHDFFREKGKVRTGEILGWFPWKINIICPNLTKFYLSLKLDLIHILRCTNFLKVDRQYHIGCVNNSCTFFSKIDYRYRLMRVITYKII